MFLLVLFLGAPQKFGNFSVTIVPFRRIRPEIRFRMKAYPSTKYPVQCPSKWGPLGSPGPRVGGSGTP